MQNSKHIIIEHAQRLGFSFIGFSKAGKMDEESRHLEQWLNKGFHGKMSYMENHFDKRTDPTLLVPGAKTVVSLMYNYYTDEKQKDEHAPKISKYAYGKDYHFIIKDKLKTLVQSVEEELGTTIAGRVFVDSAPVLERDWAKRSGLGWIGKNTLLIRPSAGSFFFLAEWIMDLEVAPDSPMKDHCGTCRKCIDVCPTDAIAPEGYLLDGSKCISYLTIELREDLPNAFQGKMEDWMFGCDICQDVCPWNRFSLKHQEPSFEPDSRLLELTKEEWNEMSCELFNEIFRKSPVKRTKYEGLKRNINFLRPLE